MRGDGAIKGVRATKERKSWGKRGERFFKKEEKGQLEYPKYLGRELSSAFRPRRKNTEKRHEKESQSPSYSEGGLLSGRGILGKIQENSKGGSMFLNAMNTMPQNAGKGGKRVLGKIRNDP